MTYQPVLRTQADLARAWHHLMQPLGFSRSSVWMMLVDGDDHPLPQLIEVVECDQPPDADAAAGFASLVEELLGDFCPGGRCALLFSRPGGSAVTPTDLAWARALVDACRAGGVPTDVMHLACDTDVIPLPYDVLARSA